MTSSHRNFAFDISERKILLRLFDVGFLFLALYIVGDLMNIHYIDISNYRLSWIVAFIFYVNIYGTIFELYHLPATVGKNFDISQSVFLTSVAVVGTYLLTPIFSPSLPANRIEILYMFVVVFFTLLSWRFFYKRYLTSTYFIKRLFLICDQNNLSKLTQAIETADSSYRVVGSYSLDQDMDKTLLTQIKDAACNEVVICSHYDVSSIHKQIMNLIENGVVVKDFMYAYEKAFNKIPVDLIREDFYRYFPFSRFNTNRLYMLCVRIGEVLFSLFGCLVLLLIIPFVCIGNLIGNRGKLFYSQERIGLNGQPFMILKFRTMVADAEKNGAVFAQKNDMRITKFGKLMRKTRIDELPQFINVLKGEMAVIGPRPERQVFVEKITDIMPYYPARHAIKPGLTGWAQVNYRYGDSLEDSVEKLKYDLFYIKHRGAFLDANIIIKTIGAVVNFKGQ